MLKWYKMFLFNNPEKVKVEPIPAYQLDENNPADLKVMLMFHNVSMNINDYLYPYQKEFEAFEKIILKVMDNFEKTAIQKIKTLLFKCEQPN